MTPNTDPAEMLPLLARGKHRNPHQGASFMELVSYLAGEPWSDHPRCTHPLLALLARSVNDETTDEARPRLAQLIPMIIELRSDDPRWDVEIALRAAGAAVGVVNGEHQQVLALGLLTCERALDAIDDRKPGSMRPETRALLDSVPSAQAWARGFTSGSRVTARRFRARVAPAIVRSAVEGLAQACVPDPDARLYALLAGAIEECRTWAGLGPLPLGALVPDNWLPVCRPAGQSG